MAELHVLHVDNEASFFGPGPSCCILPLQVGDNPPPAVTIVRSSL